MSGTLHIITERRLARLYFRRGSLADAGISIRQDGVTAPRERRAYAPELSGEDAQAERLRKMAALVARLPRGHFNFLSSEPDTASPLALDIEAVLLDALRQQDEAAARGEAAA